MLYCYFCRDPGVMTEAAAVAENPVLVPDMTEVSLQKVNANVAKKTF